MVTVLLQFWPRYDLAHTAKSRPAAVKVDPIQNGHATVDRKLSPSIGRETLGPQRRRTATASRPTCTSRDGRDSRLAATLTLNDNATQYSAQPVHIINGIR